MIRFNIDLRPMAAPRPRAVKGGHGYFPKQYMEWRHAFGWLIREQVAYLPSDHSALPLEGPVAVRIVLRADGFEVTVSDGAERPAKLTGDLDNYAKGILDVLCDAGIIVNDRQVTRLLVEF